jgi:cytochrome c
MVKAGGIGMAFGRVAFLVAGMSALVSGTAFADGDPAAGKKIFAQCAACHTVVPGKNTLGPSLHGVVGRKAGMVDSFKTYSPALKKSDIVWTEENLKKYLSDPKGFIPGNRMIFAGLKREQDQENVIAFLKQASQE